VKNRLLSLLISFLTFVCHIHFRPIGSPLFVFTLFIVFHSLPAFFLSVILDFAIKTVFPIPVVIVSASGIISVAALSCSLCWVVIPALESVISFLRRPPRLHRPRIGCHPGSQKLVSRLSIQIPFGYRWPPGTCHPASSWFDRSGPRPFSVPLARRLGKAAS
jgi:hypothetical protein